MERKKLNIDEGGDEQQNAIYTREGVNNRMIFWTRLELGSKT